MALTAADFADPFNIRKMFKSGPNPADKANDRISQIPGQTNQYYQPYFDKGKEALNKTYDEYGNLIENPGGKLNDIGQNYQQSPGFKFAMEQALKSSGGAAAAGGMAGSPQHEQQNMGIATGLANQDYNNWLQQATGLYNQGLKGQSDISHMGQQAGQSQAEMIAQTLAQQGNLDYQGQQYENENSPWNHIAKLGGQLAAFAPMFL